MRIIFIFQGLATTVCVTVVMATSRIEYDIPLVVAMSSST